MAAGNENYQFCEMTAEHYEECAELWEKTEGMGVTSDSKEEIKSYIERNKGMSFVCIEKSSGKVIGTNLAGHDGRRGIMYHLAVDNAHRGKALGTRLVKLSADALKKAGIKRCLIMVKTDNVEGAQFWAKTGWNHRVDLQPYSIDLTKLE